ncbi:hypothetical protein ABPG72_001314 [Tetrahymena utriculariae]
MNHNLKHLRLFHNSLNHKRKCHIFKIFKKEEYNSPFEFKDEKKDNEVEQKISNAKDQLQSYEIHNMQTAKQKENEQKNLQMQTISEVLPQLEDSIKEKNEESQVEQDQEFQNEHQKDNQAKSQNNISPDVYASQNRSLQIEDKAQSTTLGYINKNRFQYQQQSIKKSILPPFQQLDDGFIHSYTLYSKNLQLHSPFRWTPYIQHQDISEREFQLKMKQFKKKKIFDVKDEAELIDTFLFQALKNTGFDYYYDYICQPSNSCPFHGRIDFLIYHRDAETKVPLVPILRARKEKNSLGEWEDKFNQAELLGAAIWALTNMKARDPQISVCRAIQTNGNQWRMIQINDKGDFEKTHIYTPEKDEYQKIYRDEEAQSVALGLIKFALNQPDEKEVALKKVYDFVDERKYLTELDPETKSKLDRIHKNYFFLPKFVRDFLFGYK